MPTCPQTFNGPPGAHTGYSGAIRRTREAFKKLEGDNNIYSVRVGLEYRALAVMKKDRVIWYWIGSHAEYDRLV